MRKKIFVLLLMIAALSNINAQFRTPEAGRSYFWLFSPALVSKGMGLGGIQNPSGMIINPASNAFIQNIKMEFSYGMAPAFWAVQNGESFTNAIDVFTPFIANGGFVIPTRYGNFTGYLNYMNMSNNSFSPYFDSALISGNNDLGIGKVGSIYFGFSKDYSDNFAFGFDVNLKISYNPRRGDSTYNFDVGGGMDFGFIFRPEWYVPFSKKADSNWALQNFQFSIVLKELGKPLWNFSPIENLNWFAMPFTLGGGVDFNLFNNGTTHWKWLFDLSFPFFQNLVLSVGTEVQILDFIILRSSYTFDLEGVLEYSGAIPQYGYLYNMANASFGISFKFSSRLGKKKKGIDNEGKTGKENEFSIDLGARPYHSGFIFELGCTIQIGTKDEDPPEITYIQKDTYASPNLDGVQDTITIELDIKDERYIRAWRMEIYDAEGNIVRTIANKEERKETIKFKDVVKKYFSPKTGIPVPKEVEWDGRDDNGVPVKDGTYSFKFFAMDDNKNTNPEGTAAGEIFIDTEKPEISSEVTNTIFSPNNDGSKDTLIIDIEIIKEEIEEIYIENEPLPLYELESTSFNIIEKPMLPQLIQADNSDSQEEKLPVTEQLWYVDILNSADKVIRQYTFKELGKYKLEWDAKDDKGNQMPDGVYKVKLHSTDKAGNYWEQIITNIIINTEPTPIEATILSSIFSPNADGVKDGIDFEFKVPVQKGIEKWEYSINKKDGRPVKLFSGEGPPPLKLSWDGIDENGGVSKEGSYNGRLTVIYENGNMPYGETPEFVIDVTPPDADVKLSLNLFSPDGDGRKDELEISQTTTTEDEWQATLFDQDDRKVKSYVWKGEVPKKLVWDGKDDDGKLLSDGNYQYQISSRDRAGNYFESEKYAVKIFTADTPVFITSTYDSFSPNGDGVKDRQTLDIRAQISSDNRVKEWKLSILDENDTEVYNSSKTGTLPPSMVWDGLSNDKKLKEDGFYKARLTVGFESGASSTSQTQPFTLDNTAPVVEIKELYTKFSPDNDGHKDSFEIIQQGSNEEQWNASIVDRDNKILWQSFYSGEPRAKELWDGKDLNGNIQKNGLYKYVIESTDRAGNSARAEISALELKVLYTSAYLTLEDDKFSPNSDGTYDVLNMRSFVNEEEGIESYKVEIIDRNGSIVKTFSGESMVPEQISWDGKDETGLTADDGLYSARLTVTYDFGNRPEIESSQFMLDNTPPVIDLSMSPEFFSPDDDNVDDELNISINSFDLTGIKEWKIDIRNPRKTKSFFSYEGAGNITSSIIWNGKGGNGEVVESAEDYPVMVYAVDEVGNVLEKEVDPILVDILVIKLDDGRLKIKISNIAFKPNSAEMTNSPKNRRIINLIARALKKYNLYKITIEGHANRFREGLDERLAKDLSTRRAQTIARELNKKGIAMNRMTTIGRGFDQPLVPLTKDADKEELAKNRRVEFYLKKNN